MFLGCSRDILFAVENGGKRGCKVEVDRKKEGGSSHQSYIDYLRVIATVFVIGVHTVSLASSKAENGSPAFLVLECFDFLFLSCNLLFLMISGALLLPVRGEGIFAFFRKRFSKTAIPLAAYYVLYVCAKEGIAWIYPDHWAALIRRMLAGPPQEAPHFWLVYAILFLYLLTPFLRWFLARIPDKTFCGMVAFLFLLCALDTYLPFFGRESPFRWVSDSLITPYLMGYLLAEKCSLTAEKFFLIGGAASFFFSCCWIVAFGNYEDYIYQNAPTMLLFSSSIFLLVKRFAPLWERGMGKTASFFVRFVGRYSYSILLIHWGVLHFAVKQLLGVDVLSGGIWGGVLLTMALTLLLSGAGAFLLEHTLLAWLRFPFQREFHFHRK